MTIAAHGKDPLLLLGWCITYRGVDILGTAQRAVSKTINFTWCTTPYTCHFSCYGTMLQRSWLHCQCSSVHLVRWQAVSYADCWVQQRRSVTFHCPVTIDIGSKCNFWVLVYIDSWTGLIAITTLFLIKIICREIISFSQYFVLADTIVTSTSSYAPVNCSDCCYYYWCLVFKRKTNSNSD